MTAGRFIRRLKELAAAWGLSLALHVAVLGAVGVAGMLALRAAPQPAAREAPPVVWAAPTALSESAVARGDPPLADVAPLGDARPATIMPPASAPTALDETAMMSAAFPAAPPGSDRGGAADPVTELGPILAASPHALASGGHGPAIGLLDGTSAGFGQHVGELRGTGLDVVFVLDATDSMGPAIEQAKKRLRQILDVVVGLVPNARFGVVAYKDYGDDYGPDACKSMPITPDARAVGRFLDGITAGGGGDIPEPIHEAVRIAASEKMGWDRRRKRVIILVGDSPCHAMGRKEALASAAAFAKQGGTLSAIDTGDPTGQRNLIQSDLADVAKHGGGEAFLLKDADAFWRHLIVSIFGRRFEQDVDTIIQRLVPEE